MATLLAGMKHGRGRSFVKSLAALPSLQRAAQWLVTDAPFGPIRPTALRSTAAPPLNAVCDSSFWQDGEWRTYGRALGLPQDEGWYHRKAWEWTQCIYGLERLNALGREKLVLGVGAGHEQVLYYLANRSLCTVGTDLYSAISPPARPERPIRISFPTPAGSRRSSTTNPGCWPCPPTGAACRSGAVPWTSCTRSAQ